MNNKDFIELIFEKVKDLINDKMRKDLKVVYEFVVESYFVEYYKDML